MRKLKKYYAFVTYWAVNSLLLYLATLVYPAAYTLGNFRFSVLWAAIVAGFIWTVLVWFSEPILGLLKVKVEGGKQMIFYLLANFIALWLVARIAFFSGFGVASFVWVFVLALVGNLVQYLVMKIVKV